MATEIPLSEAQNCGRVRLLVSVRTGSEAAAALAGGADIIDVKEPNAGSLGDAGELVRRAVVGVVRQAGAAGAVVVSAALGELAEAVPAASFVVTPGVSLFKLGLAALGGGRRWTDLLRGWAARLGEQEGQLVPVAYADHMDAGAPAPGAVLDHCIESGLPYLLVDTWRKPGPLLESWPAGELYPFAARASESGVKLVLAGSLRAVDLPLILALRPFAIGVRGAVCLGGARAASLDAGLVSSLASALRALSAPVPKSLPV